MAIEIKGLSPDTSLKTAIVDSEGRLITQTGQGTSYINGKPQGTVFGVDIVVAHRATAVAAKWDMGIPIKALNFEFVGSGYAQCTLSEETIEIGTGTDANAEVKIWSKKRVRYSPGNPLFLDYTLAFPKLEDSNGNYTIGFGFYDKDNALLQGQRRVDGVIEWGFIVVRDGIEQWYPQNGIEFPDYADRNDLNIYYMDGGYLGVAPSNLYLSDINEVFKRLHRQLYQQRITNVKTPDLPVGGFLRNEGNTLDIKVLNGSVAGGTINGFQEEDPVARTKTYSVTRTIPTSAADSLVVSFLNPTSVDMFDRIDGTLIPRTRVYTNTISSKLVEIQGVLTGQNKSGVINLYVTDEANITSGTYTPVDLGYSVLEVSTDAVVNLVNAELLEQFPFGSTSNISPKVIDALDLLEPGNVAVFVITSASTSFELLWKIIYADRF